MTQKERMLILVLPLLGLLIPLSRIGPPLYRWRTERRIYRWYRNLGRLEAEARAGIRKSHKAVIMIFLPGGMAGGRRRTA